MTTETVWFVGATTASSIVHQTFPLWARVLDVDARVEGRDLPIGSAAGAYRALLDDMVAMPGVVGAVITVHKVALFEAAAERFTTLEPNATACGEVNSIRVEGARLSGFARDPVSVGRVVDRIWPQGAQAICIGAGGTGVALGRALLGRPDPPERFVFADPSSAALAGIEAKLGAMAAQRRVELVVMTGAGPWDDVVGGAPAGALIVNATGMGKDRPGSPVSASVRFPRRSVAWELNYRGDLAFLRAARSQAGVSAHDGWQLFCHGWAAALGAVFGRADQPDLGDRFAEAAEELRPS